jgi:hypothetical protein
MFNGLTIEVTVLFALALPLISRKEKASSTENAKELDDLTSVASSSVQGTNNNSRLARVSSREDLAKYVRDELRSSGKIDSGDSSRRLKRRPS